ncbi:MAG: LamG domain-containing protein, partial [Methanosarcinaceae archaeon]
MVKLRVIIGVLVVIGVLTGMSTGVQAQNDDGLVAEWHFDEGEGSVLKDSSGNGNDGVIYGATWVEGKYGGALSFDGVDDYVIVGITNGPTNTFTFEAWIKSEATHQIDGQSTSGTRGTIGQRYAFWPSQLGSSNAGAGLSIGTNGISVYEHGSSYMPALAVYSDNIGTGWNHIAVVYSNKKPSIYLNGILVLTGYTSPRVNVNIPVRFGSGSYGSHKGCIDEICIYNRALTA